MRILSIDLNVWKCKAADVKLNLFIIWLKEMLQLLCLGHKKVPLCLEVADL